MDHVVADGVSPVLPGIFQRVSLEEEVVPSLPVAEPVRVVNGTLRVDVVVNGAVSVGRQALTRSRKAQDQLVGLQRGKLLSQRIWICPLRDLRDEVRVYVHARVSPDGVRMPIAPFLALDFMRPKA